MKINRHIFHLPPFISTSWKAIDALHMEGTTLVVSLVNGSRIELPPLDEKLVMAIYTIHAQVLEQEHPMPTALPAAAPEQQKTAPVTGENTLSLNLALPPMLANMENMGAFLQHNPEQAQSSDLPKEMLEKIAALSQSIGIQDSTTLPKAEPHCNCYYCQIARAMHGDAALEEAAAAAPEIPEEELVTEDDLKFRIWDIQQTADNLYLVTNPTDGKEYYSVFLGDPIGCTCGDKNCEHIRAVLKS